MCLGIRRRRSLRPFPPGVSVECIYAIGLEELHKLLAPHIGEACANADVLEVVTVVKAEEERADRRFLSALVPAEAGHDAVTLPCVLHLEHHSLVWLVLARFRLRDDSVESCALEPAEPVGGGRSVARCRREVKRRLRVSEKRLESRASFGEWRVAKTSILLAQQVEEDD